MVPNVRVAPVVTFTIALPSTTPEAIKLVPVAAPITGVTSVGEVASTTVVPLPVVVAAMGCALPFDPTTVADVGKAVPFIFAVVVAQEVADVVVSPVSAGMAPHGSPVAFVNVTADGVPRFGVVLPAITPAVPLVTTTCPVVGADAKPAEMLSAPPVNMCVLPAVES